MGTVKLNRTPSRPGRLQKHLRFGWFGLMLAGSSVAQDIAPFRLTGTEGYVNSRFLTDELQTSQSAGGAGTQNRQGQSSFRNEIFLMTHSYIYHPKFLTLDIGGGPILDRMSYDSDTGSISNRSSLYNFTGRATFFRDKPIHGSLFYDHLSPTVTLAPGLVMTQESTRYGFDLGASGAKMPLPARMAFTHSETVGQSSEMSVNDVIDQTSISVSRSYGSIGGSQFQFQSVQQLSRSGNLNLPIQETSSSSNGMSLDTRLNFGKDREFDLTNLISANTRGYTVSGLAQPEQQDLNFLLNLQAKHSEQLNSFGVYQRSSSSQGVMDSTAQTIATGLSYAPTQTFGMSAGARLENTDTRQYASQNQGLDASVRHELALPVGTLQTGYSARFERRDQQAIQAQAPSLDEHALLSGFSYVTLARQRVISGSVAVYNLTRTQRYVEGADYELLVIGLETRIRRLAGAILDGQEVLIDYAYDTGGTYGLDQLDQSLNLNWSMSRYLHAYLRRFESSPQLTSGSPTFPLNQISSNVYGARADLPLTLGISFTVGGSIEYENRQETIAPYRRESGDIFIQTDESLFGLGNFRVGGHRTKVDYATVGQDMNLEGVDIRYWARPWFGVDVSAGTIFERDMTGLTSQRRNTDTINAQWRERKLLVTATFAHSRETQGSYERNRTMFQMNLRRDF